jgi:hypothetical protein
MYSLKNYMLSMQSHWYLNQPVYKAVQDSIPAIARYRAKEGTEDLGQMPIQTANQKDLARDLSGADFSQAVLQDADCEEIDNMRRVIGFEPNAGEDELRQIPEIVLKEHVPELYRNMWHVVQNVLSPIIFSLYQREVAEIASVQIANYNLKDKQQGAWHHDESADISVVIPLNTGDYKGGGTEFHNHGVLSPLPSGHALIFPSFTNLHRGLPVEEGDRYLLVFWLYDRKRAIHLYEEVVE